MAARGRAVFLQQAASLAAAPVPPAARRGGWRWWRPGLALFLALALGVGAIGAAAQASLPGEALWGVKTTLEEATLQLARDPAAGAALGVRLAGRRLDELARLGAAPEGEAAAARYAAQLDAALAQAARLDDAGLAASLPPVRGELQAQMQQAASLAGGAGVQARQIVRTRLTWVESPGALRARFGGPEIPPPPVTPPTVIAPTRAPTRSGAAATAPPSGAATGQGPRRTPAAATEIGPHGPQGGGLTGTSGPQATARPGTAAARRATAGANTAMPDPGGPGPGGGAEGPGAGEGGAGDGAGDGSGGGAGGGGRP